MAPPLSKAVLLSAAFVVALLLGTVPWMAGSDTARADSPLKFQVRVWQNLEDRDDVWVSARVVDGSWKALRTIPLSLDDGFEGRYRYGEFRIEAPQRQEPPAYIDVRIWQNLEDEQRFDISARPQGASWLMLGRVGISLDDGLSTSGRYRYGDITGTVPLSTLPWYRLDGPAPCPGVHPPGWGAAYFREFERLSVSAVCIWVDDAGEVRTSRLWEFYIGFRLWGDIEITGDEKNLTLSFFDPSYYVPDTIYLIDGVCTPSSSLAPGTGIAGPVRSFATVEACVQAGGVARDPWPLPPH